MKIHRFALPACAAAAAALLLAPRSAEGFATNGSSLGLGQRDFRVYNNFTDVTANNNVTPHANFPGYTGAVMSMWKGVIEWQSELHGDGTGDPFQSNLLGSGGANFDPSFQGQATGVGTSNNNIISQLSGDGGSVYAFAEGPYSDGWRVRFYENPWNWQDGPGNQGTDLQGIATHEYGHCLGLNHSGSGGATMQASTPSGIEQRSLHSDDIAGVQAIYGVKDALKPRISGAVMNTGTGILTLTGVNFSSSGNIVWFTQEAQGGNGNPITVAGVSSSGGGTQILVAVPAAAGPGDVQVQKNGTGNSSLSNAWPVDPGTSGGTGGIVINSINPTSLAAVAIDGFPNVSLFGSGFLDTTSVSVDGIDLLSFPPEFSILSDSQIDIIDWPYVGQLGSVTVEVTGSTGSDTIQMQVIANDPPVMELVGSQSEGGFLFSATGLDITMGGTQNSVHFLSFSGSNLPSSLPGFVDYAIGNNFFSLFSLGNYGIPAEGHAHALLPVNGSLAGVTIYLQSAVLIAGNPQVFPLTMSNMQSGQFLF